MFSKIKNLYTSNLKYEGTEQLTRLSVFFIIAIDIFVFTVMNYGIDFQTKIINNPKAAYVYDCRSTFKSPSNILSHTNYIYTRSDFSNTYDSIRKQELSPVCQTLFSKIEKVRSDIDFTAYKKDFISITKEEQKVYKELNRIRKNYNTELFEKMANKSGGNSIVKTRYLNLKKKHALLIKQLESKKLSFEKNKHVQSLHSFVESNKHIPELYAELIENYHVNTRVLEIIFVLPILLIFLYLSRRFLLEQKYIPHVLTKNLLIVSLIPFTISSGSLLYNYIPHIFIGKVIDFFYSLGVPVLAYYILAAIAIFIGYFIILKIQKNEKIKREQTKNNKLSFRINFNNNVCNNCLNKVNYFDMNFCPHCSDALKIKCDHCEELKIKALKFCHNCGNS